MPMFDRAALWAAAGLALAALLGGPAAALDGNEIGIQDPVAIDRQRAKGAAPHVFVRPLAGAQGQLGDDGTGDQDHQVTLPSPAANSNAQTWAVSVQA